MPSCHDPDLAVYPLYQEGYDDGWQDADRDHRFDVVIGILLGSGATFVSAFGVPWLFHLVWP